MTQRFSDLSAADREIVLARGNRFNVQQGWSLIWERTGADKAYLITAGEVSIQRKGVEIARLGAGDFVGETAIVEHRLRTATVVAATKLEVVHFTREVVEELCQELPAFAALLSESATAHQPAQA
jgi:CRP/FNR family cyclic AMP-dependent transcriptional regulator